MAPVLMAARQCHLETVSKILSLCLDCCENVDNKSLNLLHYLAFRGSSSPLGRSLFKRGGIQIVYRLLRNLMELEGAFGMTPQEVFSVLRSEKHHQKQVCKYILHFQGRSKSKNCWKKLRMIKWRTNQLFNLACEIFLKKAWRREEMLI
ncbi:uncharacterized protein [Gossypium hirsutum]|uniref:Uncharacterized protein n=1 Tax=Gossypium hirsutum TaxID=3635 RepID=A0ABM2ZWI8_GOSHI|nr:uncharacterized protein LOC107910822 [Gossypium hirsutum]